MRDHELKVYRGPKEKCDQCGRAFERGEVISPAAVLHGGADVGEFVFCYSDAEGGCLQMYMFFKMQPPQPLFGEPMVFRERPATTAPAITPHPWWQFWK